MTAVNNARELIEARIENIRSAREHKDLEHHLMRMFGYLEALEDFLLITEVDVDFFSAQTEKAIHARLDELAAQTSQITAKA